MPNYVEPFAGSLAVLLARPHAPRTETVNDKDCFLSNFWRALAADPEQLCTWCDWPVNEADLHARHTWLQAQREAGFAEKMMSDPDFCDVKIAGWWVWGLCQWIGGEWCSPRAMTWQPTPALGNYGQGINRQHRVRPIIEAGGRGVLRSWIKRPRIAEGGRGILRTWHRSPDLNNGGRGVPRTEHDLLNYLLDLAARIRRVRVCCGDFERILGPTATTVIGLTAVLLDPPYSAEAGRDSTIYAEEDLTVAHRAREWALAHGGDPKLRIALCGYEGEHAMPPDWECVAWKSHGGTARKNTGNCERERIWFSPQCLREERPLFATEQDTRGAEAPGGTSARPPQDQAAQHPQEVRTSR